MRLRKRFQTRVLCCRCLILFGTVDGYKDLAVLEQCGSHSKWLGQFVVLQSAKALVHLELHLAIGGITHGEACCDAQLVE